jgi:hypothetical protein
MTHKHIITSHLPPAESAPMEPTQVADTAESQDSTTPAQSTQMELCTAQIGTQSAWAAMEGYPKNEDLSRDQDRHVGQILSGTKHAQNEACLSYPRSSDAGEM